MQEQWENEDVYLIPLVTSCYLLWLYCFSPKGHSSCQLPFSRELCPPGLLTTLSPSTFRLLGGIFCYIRKYHRLSGLKQHTFIISKFLWVKNQGWLNRILDFIVSQETMKGLDQSWCSSEGSTKEIHLHGC